MQNGAQNWAHHLVLLHPKSHTIVVISTSITSSEVLFVIALHEPFFVPEVGTFILVRFWKYRIDGIGPQALFCQVLSIRDDLSLSLSFCTLVSFYCSCRTSNLSRQSEPFRQTVRRLRDCSAMPSTVSSPASWEEVAAATFACGLRRPQTYGEPPRRDVIGWVASLFDHIEIHRWITLCAVLRMRHPIGSDPTLQDASLTAIITAIIEHVVMPLHEGETRRVLTTNIRRHVRRTAASGLTFMHALDFHLALFDLEEGLHNSATASFFPSSSAGFQQHLFKQLEGFSFRTGKFIDQNGEPNGHGNYFGEEPNGFSEILSHQPDESTPLELDLTAKNLSNRSSQQANADIDLPSWQDIFALKYLFNVAVEKFSDLCAALRTKHVQECIERFTTHLAWAARHASLCGLDLGQARVINLVVLKGSSAESQLTLQRSHFTVFQENDPLVYAAAISTLDPERAIFVADKYVGLNVGHDAIQLSSGGSKITLNPGRSASNIRKLLYADALSYRRSTGTLSDSSFMHLCQKLTLLNSGHGESTPGSRWAEPWPHWPAIEDGDKELLESRYVRGNIVAGALLAATILANHVTGVGSIATFECAEAITRLKKITELGDAAAPNYVGLALSMEGSLQNIPESIRYYRIAVERGNKNAPAVLGKLLLNLGHDASECVDLCKLTIARGGRYGHRYLADILIAGAPGVPQDTEEAWRLYEEAANLGDPVAADKVATK